MTTAFSTTFEVEEPVQVIDCTTLIQTYLFLTWIELSTFNPVGIYQGKIFLSLKQGCIFGHCQQIFHLTDLFCEINKGPLPLSVILQNYLLCLLCVGPKSLILLWIIFGGNPLTMCSLKDCDHLFVSPFTMCGKMNIASVLMCHDKQVLHWSFFHL